MATMQDSSVLFSLKQLQSLEEARLREEREAQQARAEAEKQAREEAARREAEAAAAQARADAERKAAEEAEKRAEAARLEALRAAAVERARAEAEVKARTEQMRIAQEHERVLAALEQDAQKRRLKRTVTWGAVGAIALFAAAGGVYFGKIRPDAEAALLAKAADANAAGEDAAKLQQKLDEQEKRLREAQRALDDLANAPKPQPNAAAPAGTSKTPVPGSGPKKVTPQDPGCTCVEGDPLCRCLR
jgi:hypothetical protein